jgi:hypothetical protein
VTEKDVAALLVRLLAGNGNPRPIKGSELSVLVRASAHDFAPEKFGCRNLRDFIRKYAFEEIMEIGKAGMDVVYGLRSVGQQQPLFESSTPTPTPTKSADYRGSLGQLLSNPRIWKTFASPESPFRLFLAPSTKQIVVLRPGYGARTETRIVHRCPHPFGVKGKVHTLRHTFHGLSVELGYEPRSLVRRQCREDAVLYSVQIDKSWGTDRRPAGKIPLPAPD